MLMDLRAGIRGLGLFELCILCLEKLIVLLPSQSHFLGVLLAFYSLNCDHFHRLYPVRPAITLVLRVRIYSNMINIPANGLGTTRIVSLLHAESTRRAWKRTPAELSLAERAECVCASNTHATACAGPAAVHVCWRRFPSRGPRWPFLNSVQAAARPVFTSMSKPQVFF